MARESSARQSARRQALGRWAAVLPVGLVQNAAMVLFGGIPLIENPTQPRVIAWQARCCSAACFFSWPLSVRSDISGFVVVICGTRRTRGCSRANSFDQKPEWISGRTGD